MKVHKEVGDLIDFYEIQWYNQGPGAYETCDGLWTTSPETWPGTTVSELVASGIPGSKIVIGKPGAQGGEASPSTCSQALSHLALQTRTTATCRLPTSVPASRRFVRAISWTLPILTPGCRRTATRKPLVLWPGNGLTPTPTGSHRSPMYSTEDDDERTKERHPEFFHTLLLLFYSNLFDCTSTLQHGAPSESIVRIKSVP